MDCLAFIVSSPRSGSTLLTRILNSHSKLAVPCEIMLPKYFINDSAEFMARDKFSIICRYYQIEEKKAAHDYCYFMSKILDKEGKGNLILKHPRYSMFVPQISNDFPKAKFIHLVRDVRSVASSVLFKDRYTSGRDKWCLYNQSILDSFKSIDDGRKIFVRYEDIVENPEKTITRILLFLGFSFEKEILEFGMFSHADDEMTLWNGKRPSDSPLQKMVSTGVIVNPEKKQHSVEIIDLYNQGSKEVRALNEFFGY
jgi:Sulfotransferase family